MRQRRNSKIHPQIQRRLGVGWGSRCRSKGFKKTQDAEEMLSGVKFAGVNVLLLIFPENTQLQGLYFTGFVGAMRLPRFTASSPPGEAPGGEPTGLLPAREREGGPMTPPSHRCCNFTVSDLRCGNHAAIFEPCSTSRSQSAQKGRRAKRKPPATLILKHPIRSPDVGMCPVGTGLCRKGPPHITGLGSRMQRVKHTGKLNGRVRAMCHGDLLEGSPQATATTVRK